MNCKTCDAEFYNIDSRCRYCCTKCRETGHRQAQAKYRAKTDRSAYHKKWASENPEETRNRHYRKRYGVEIPFLENLLEKQQNKCAICKREIQFRGIKGRNCAVVDHCHTTKKVRGMLCTPCNLMIGYAQDNPQILASAINYLEN